MTSKNILFSIDAEISRLLQARALLSGVSGRRTPTVPPAKATHKISAAGRAKIAAAQRKRWAAQKKTAK
jgi:hypothetical protein